MAERKCGCHWNWGTGERTVCKEHQGCGCVYNYFTKQGFYCAEHDPKQQATPPIGTDSEVKRG